MTSATIGGTPLESTKSPAGWVCMNCMEHFSEPGPALRHLCPKHPSRLRGMREERDRCVDLIDTAATEAERQLIEAYHGKCQPPTIAGVLLALRVAVTQGGK